MNSADQELDAALLRRFALQPEPEADEQFLQQLHLRLERERRWMSVRRLAPTLAVVLVLAAATPWAVSASQSLGRVLQLGLATQWLWLCAPLLGVWPLLRLRAR